MLACGRRISTVLTVIGMGGSWSRKIWCSRFKSVNNHWDHGGPGRETFGLAFGRRISTMSTVTGIGDWLGNKYLSSFLDLRWVVDGGRLSKGSPGSWSRNKYPSSLLDLCLVVASQTCQQSQGLGIGGSWSRNAERSSLLESRWVVASHKC